MSNDVVDVRMTEYSHGAGCGCKISPQVLDGILKTGIVPDHDPELWVGNNTRDDAAVYRFTGDEALISTTDFFMPIVDDPFDFGRIAAVNAISDIYAMGGTPLVAIAILGWPVDKLPVEVANRVLEGGRAACKEAGIQIAGGHSIDSPEPIFGLSVSGKVHKEHLKRNDQAREGDLLYLTKPIGVGILTTAEKKSLLKPGDEKIATESMTKLNSIGEALGKLAFVHAMTDVTGFGLLGHLTEMCEGSGLSAEISYTAVPKLESVEDYIKLKSFPGGSTRNFNSYGHKISSMEEDVKMLLCDPQTSGGLLVSIDPSSKEEFEEILMNAGVEPRSIGRMLNSGQHIITVKE